jgi:hypothetical protein
MKASEHKTHAQHTVNARLIAAAPELLAALMAAYEQAEESDGGRITVGMRERMAAVIAKAEGTK